MTASKPHSELRSELDEILVKLDQAMGSGRGSWSEIEALEQRRDAIIESLFEQVEALQAFKDSVLVTQSPDPTVAIGNLIRERNSLKEQYAALRKEADAEHSMGEDARRVGRELMAENARLKEQLETAQAIIREIGATYDGVTPIFRKTGTKLLGADAFTYAPDICEALNAARRWPVTYPASSPGELLGPDPEGPTFPFARGVSNQERKP